MLKRICLVGLITSISVLGWGAKNHPPKLTDDAKLYRSLGYVTVTQNGPEDGGDFGPKTPGTKTDGIQEAIDCAHGLKDPNWAGGVWAAKNLYIGRGLYRAFVPIHVPWMGELWYLEARQAMISYGGKKGPLIHIDSMMNCDLHFGYFIGSAIKEGPVVLIKPMESFDDAPKGVFAAKFSCFAIVGGGQAHESTQIPTGIGLMLDASSGPICGCQFNVIEINACDKSFVADSPPGGGGILQNLFVIQSLHLCNVGMILGREGKNDVFNNQLTIVENEQKHPSLINGHHNILTLIDNSTREGNLDLVFGPQARDNVVYATRLDKKVQDRSASGSNRLILNAPAGLGLKTPPVPKSGESLANRTAQAVDVFITDPGQVMGWELSDADGRTVRIKHGMMAGQTFRFNPGDKVKFIYNQPPEWTWKGI